MRDGVLVILIPIDDLNRYRLVRLIHERDREFFSTTFPNFENELAPILYPGADITDPHGAVIYEARERDNRLARVPDHNPLRNPENIVRDVKSSNLVADHQTLNNQGVSKSDIDRVFASNSDDEILDFMEGIRQDNGWTSNKKRDKNLAYVEVNIDGSSTTFVISNKNRIPADDRILRDGLTLNDQGHYVVVDSKGVTRQGDSERAALEYIARNIGASSVGTVRMVSELKVCEGCQSAATNFERIYPNVTVRFQASEIETIAKLKKYRSGQ